MKKNLSFDHYLDLRGFACPVNFVRCCIALENLSFNQVLKVDLDIGESEISVTEGLKEKGYKVEILNKDSHMISLVISSVQK